MGPCETFADRWLDHLYGLLDKEESRELADHVAICPSCQMAQTEVERDQRRMARAARWIRKVPEFQRPDQELTPITTPEIAPDREAPATLPFPAPERRSMARRLWPAWAAAAALLLAALGGRELYRQGADERDQAVASARKELRAIEAQFAALKTDAAAETQQLIAQAKAETLRLLVAGATKTQADAPYSIRVATRDFAGQPLAAQLEVRLVSADTGALIHRQDAVSTGLIDVTLPAGLKLEKSVRLEVAAKAGSAEATVRELLSASPVTHVLHLATNKAVAQHGEVVFFRALALERFSLKPPASGLPLRFSLVNAQNKSVAVVNVATGQGGIASGEFAVPATLSPGDYTIQAAAADPAQPIQAQARGLEIVDRLSDFDVRPDRKVYRPGDKVVLHVDNVRGSDGKPVKNQLVVAKVDFGKKGDFKLSPSTRGLTDADGKATIQFPLPKSFDRSRVNIQFELPGSKSETKIIRTINIAPSRLEVDFYPEGGELVAGVSQRVYFRVRTPSGETAAPNGKLELRGDKQGLIFESNIWASFGSFLMSADANETYSLRVPVGKDVIDVKDPFQKLGIKSSGVVLNATNSVAKEGEPVRLDMRRRGIDSKLAVIATCRGQVVAQQFIEADAAKVEVNLPIGVHGVVRVTVYEMRNQGLTPLAERLVYRTPARRLDLKAVVKDFEPGKHSQVNIDARDEKGQAVAGWALALVVNEQYRAERRELGLAPHFLIAGDVSADLAETALLVGDSQDPAALDLLLGTYGWRRFVSQAAEPAQYAKAAPGVFSIENLTAEQARTQTLMKLQPRLQGAQQRVDQEHVRLAEQQDGAQAALAAALSARSTYQQLPMDYFRLGLGILTAAMLVLGSLCIIAGLVSAARRRSSTWSFASAMGAMGLCLVLYFVGGALRPIHDGAPGDNAMAAGKAPPRIELARGVDFPPAQTAVWTGQATLADPPPAVARQPLNLHGALALLDTGETPTSAGVRSNFVDHPELRQRFEAARQAQQTPDQAPPTFGREFAHRQQAGFDAQPTLLWHPNLSLDQGRASVAFDVPTAAANYRIVIYGHGADGRLGFVESRATVKAAK